MKNINVYVDELAKKFNIPIKDKVAHKCLCEYVENIIFNIVSIASIIALINNCKTINSKILEILDKYVLQTCNKTKQSKVKGGGGSIVLPSEFYGVNSGNYSANNITPDVLPIDFSSGIMRPQIGGGKAVNPICDAITEILSTHKLKASSAITKKIANIIESYLACLLGKLQLSKTKVTSSMIKNTVKSSKVFNIFK
jgi:histone H3/H4